MQNRITMATQSFDEMLEIDTLEKAKRVAQAFEAADKRGPYQSSCTTDVLKELEEGKKNLNEFVEEFRKQRGIPQ